ncbi:hypothetical protein Val02_66590 [Virgisporangium aliadipatigenens]|uniref:Nucleoside phosphorylase domain-containing protein n=1 Tax=Virgisporangium aliadipatigenens TaxID=741659 RepID=A0A8J3YST2_9ACTN|nr:hypothetical protein Val02_66590 [Virgisporangium aliadipatigenens]
MSLLEVGVGNIAAAGECQRIIAEHRPEVALFVGIAGGLNDLHHGDVVVGESVVHYERGKEIRFGFRPRIRQHSSSERLIRHARTVAANAAWQVFVKGALDGEPRAMVAQIASGGKVLASRQSSSFRRLRKYCSEAVAVDMESYGFLHGVHASDHRCHALPIRGVSDLLVGKNPEADMHWQPKAARNAAAFAFAFLQSLPEFGDRTDDHHVAQGEVHQMDQMSSWQRNTFNLKRNRKLQIGNGNVMH